MAAEEDGEDWFASAEETARLAGGAADRSDDGYYGTEYGEEVPVTPSDGEAVQEEEDLLKTVEDGMDYPIAKTAVCEVIVVQARSAKGAAERNTVLCFPAKALQIHKPGSGLLF